MRYTRNYIPRREWGGALTGAATGAKMGSSIGMMFGPVGGAIGTAAGAIGGALVGNFTENKKIRQQNELMRTNNNLIAAEKYKTDMMFKKQTKRNDASYLANLDMNNASSLFMQKGGKVLDSSINLANKGAKEYRDNTASLDSLRTILRPHLVKSGKDHLTSEQIKNILGDPGHKKYNELGDYFSNAYQANKTLGINMAEFKGSNEDPNSKIAGYLYGKRIDEHKFPNATFPIITTVKGQAPVTDTTIYAYPQNSIKPAYIKKNGGKISMNGKSLKDGNKLLTNNLGGTDGTHESGANIPIVKNGKTVAIAEPGEVYVVDKEFILSKRLGFAQKFMQLEGARTSGNNKIIDKEQDKLVTMNNKMVSKSPLAYNGIDLYNIGNTARKNFMIPNSVQTSHIGTKAPSTGIQKYKGATGMTTPNTTSFLDKLKGLDTNTIVGAAGTIGNILMSNSTLNRQKKYIQNSLDTALSYEPKLNKNYLLNENVDVNDQVSAVNQGFASTTSRLDTLDSATASALKNTAGITRMNQLGQVYGNRNRMVSNIRNQNTMNIMSNNANNNATLNQSMLSKINAKIAANEEFGNLESARLSNMQGAISEFNTILRDKQIMKSLDARWKDSIGSGTAEGKDMDQVLSFLNRNKPTTNAFGGKLKKRKMLAY